VNAESTAAVKSPASLICVSQCCVCRVLLALTCPNGHRFEFNDSLLKRLTPEERGRRSERAMEILGRGETRCPECNARYDFTRPMSHGYCDPCGQDAMKRAGVA